MSLFRKLWAGMPRHQCVAQISAIPLVLLTASQVIPAFAAPAPAAPSLASVLATVKPPTGGVVLTVGAAQCPLPPGELLPGPDASVQAVAGTFHRITRVFGTVTAIAPPTMTLLNTRPVNANIYDGMPPQEAMKFLAASLTKGQWQQLKGDKGLGLSDMVTETQAGLFTAVLPRSLRVAPQTEAGISSMAPGARDLTPLLPQVRLRLRRRLEMMVPQVGDASFIPAGASRNIGQSPRYWLLSNDYFLPKSSLYGVPVRAEVDNIPKTGELDLDGPALHVAVPLAGVKTVRELLAHVGKFSGLEIYADRRWEGRTLTFLGSPASARAADILRSVAFCLTGTYRRVGTAFVLTDDVLGAGSRRAVLSEFEATASAMRQQALYAAGDALAGVESLTSLSPAADSMAYNEAQEKEAGRFYADTGFSSVTLPLDQLTPEQKAAVGAVAAYTDPNGTIHTPDLTGKIIVQDVPTLELVVPTLDGPVDAGISTTLYALFQPSPPVPEASVVPMPSSPSSPTTVPSVPMAELIKPIQGRAVLASPSTASEVQSLVATMKKLGLNQLWLPVTPTGGLALLSQAVQATRGTDIGIYAVVDLLVRPRGAAADMVDFTLLGQTSLQSRVAAVQRKTLAGLPANDSTTTGEAQQVAVSPFSAAVSKELLTLTHTLTTMPGVAGLVWRASAMPGYNEVEETDADQDFTSLGYSPAARLAFLRKEHVDPVDLFPARARGLADTSLPNFDDPATEQTLEKNWHQFRADADKSLLQSLFQQIAADGAVSALKPVLLVQQRGDRPPHFTWYGSWSGPNTPLPTFRSTPGNAPLEKVQARAQSNFIVVNLPVQGSFAEEAILRQWSIGLRNIGKTTPGMDLFWTLGSKISHPEVVDCGTARTALATRSPL